jgi:hypothetical protein
LDIDTTQPQHGPKKTRRRKKHHKISAKDSKPTDSHVDPKSVFEKVQTETASLDKTYAEILNEKLGEFHGVVEEDPRAHISESHEAHGGKMVHLNIIRKVVTTELLGSSIKSSPEITKSLSISDDNLSGFGIAEEMPNQSLNEVIELQDEPNISDSVTAEKSSPSIVCIKDIDKTPIEEELSGTNIEPKKVQLKIIQQFITNEIIGSSVPDTVKIIKTLSISEEDIADKTNDKEIQEQDTFVEDATMNDSVKSEISDTTDLDSDRHLVQLNIVQRFITTDLSDKKPIHKSLSNEVSDETALTPDPSIIPTTHIPSQVTSEAGLIDIYDSHRDVDSLNFKVTFTDCLVFIFFLLFGIYVLQNLYV